jgi:hypothetical protein
LIEVSKTSSHDVSGRPFAGFTSLSGDERRPSRLGAEPGQGAGVV